MLNWGQFYSVHVHIRHSRAVKPMMRPCNPESKNRTSSSPNRYRTKSNNAWSYPCRENTYLKTRYYYVSFHSVSNKSHQNLLSCPPIDTKKITSNYIIKNKLDKLLHFSHSHNYTVLHGALQCYICGCN